MTESANDASMTGDVRERTTGRLTPLQRVLRGVRAVFPLVGLARANAKLTRSMAAGAHKFQFLVEWGVDNPEWFDHHLDQFWAWHNSRNALSWERGVASSFALQATTVDDRRPRVLELCSGDGFNTYHFYSLLSESIVALDFDPDAIRFAKRNCQAENVEYLLGDIRYDIPTGNFENIIWDASIQHFTEEETDALMRTIVERLGDDGILSGYTIAEDPELGHTQLNYHEHEFSGRADLARFLGLWFPNVQVWETTYPNRTNLYFYASKGRLPHDRGLTSTTVTD